MKIKKGFTLFELLVSISIIALLVAIASVSYGAAQRKARDSRRTEDLNGIQKALEQYYSSNAYSYPLASGGVPVGIAPTYLQNWPKDPKTSLDYTYVPGAGTYCVCIALENPSGNSDSLDCSSFVASGGANYCVKNQQ